MTTPDDIRTVDSTAPFHVTLQRLRDELARRGITLFAEIDHARNARQAGLAMPAATVVIFGSAQAGTPLMLQAPDIALDLPLRVLVREDAGGGTVLAFHDPTRLAAAFGVVDVPPGILGLDALVKQVATA